jgi:non-canonical purine NTP pyrophosphatase (RdgB/HAM1 family)
VTFTHDWWVAVGPNGGLVAAVLLRAAEAEVADPTRFPRTITVHYLSSPREGPAELHVTAEKAGRGVSFLSVRLTQGERACAVALVALAADRSGEVALADDSGLSVRALDGAPGIFSARWAGPEKDFAFAMRKVEERLEEVGSDDRAAWFTSALAVAWPDGPAVVVEGRIDGTLTFPPRGDLGFGYDPIFVPEGRAETFGVMDPAGQDAMSQRARAFAKLRAALID